MVLSQQSQFVCANEWRCGPGVRQPLLDPGMNSCVTSCFGACFTLREIRIQHSPRMDGRRFPWSHYAALAFFFAGNALPLDATFRFAAQ